MYTIGQPARPVNSEQERLAEHLEQCHPLLPLRRIRNRLVQQERLIKHLEQRIPGNICRIAQHNAVYLLASGAVEQPLGVRQLIAPRERQLHTLVLHRIEVANPAVPVIKSEDNAPK